MAKPHKRRALVPTHFMVSPDDLAALRELAAKLHSEDPASGMSMGVLVRRAIKDTLEYYGREATGK